MLEEKEYLLIRDLAFITGVEVGEFLKRILNKWLSSRDCPKEIRDYIKKL